MKIRSSEFLRGEVIIIRDKEYLNLNNRLYIVIADVVTIVDQYDKINGSDSKIRKISELINGETIVAEGKEFLFFNKTAYAICGYMVAVGDKEIAEFKISEPKAPKIY